MYSLTISTVVFKTLILQNYKFIKNTFGKMCNAQLTSNCVQSFSCNQEQDAEFLFTKEAYLKILNSIPKKFLSLLSRTKKSQKILQHYSFFFRRTKKSLRAIYITFCNFSRRKRQIFAFLNAKHELTEHRFNTVISCTCSYRCRFSMLFC